MWYNTFQTQVHAEHIDTNNSGMHYSECLKTERLVWQTDQKWFGFQHVPISDVWALKFC